MATYMLTWNPKASPGDVTDLEQESKWLSTGQIVKRSWRVGNNKGIQVADRVFLLRQGSSSPGMIGSGRVTRGSYHHKGRWWVDFQWDIIAPNKELSKVELLEDILPSTLLKVACSGAQILPKFASKLEKRWADFHSKPLKAASKVSISPLVFSRQFARFDQQIRHHSGGKPFTSFRDGMPYEWEDYKEGVRNLALENMGVSCWKISHIGTGKILKQVISAIEIQESTNIRNNLVAWQNRYGHKNRSHHKLLDAIRSPAKRLIFERLFWDFYKDKIPDSDAFGRFIDLAGKRYDLLAYLFFLKDWNRFMPISTSNFDKAFKLLGVDLVTSMNCSWENYSAFNASLLEVQRLLREVEDVADARLIDAHSFCWMLVRQKLPKAGPAQKISMPVVISQFEPDVERPGQAVEETIFGTVTDEQFAERNSRNRRLGLLAQDVAMRSEQDRLDALGHPDSAKAVQPVWQEPARGYDILSCEMDGTPRYIEVKSARSSGSKLSFFLSRNEWEKCQSLENYWFYLVIGADSITPIVKSFSSKKLTQGCLNPVNYLAGIKMSGV